MKDLNKNEDEEMDVRESFPVFFLCCRDTSNNAPEVRNGCLSEYGRKHWLTTAAEVRALQRLLRSRVRDLACFAMPAWNARLAVIPQCSSDFVFVRAG